MSKQQGLFTKGYTPKWSKKIFTKKVKKTNSITYIIEDQNKQIIQGRFYLEVLLEIHFTDVYLIVKMKTKGNMIYVEWLGFDKTNNSWTKKCH